MNNAPIGVFDSGVGGLTVAREIMRQLPNESIIYFGDMARVPYGSKSKDTVISFSKQIVKFLQEKKVKAIVTACNTACAFALSEIMSEVDVPVVGVIEPGAKAANAITNNNKVGIIATEGTVRSGMYSKVIKKINPEIQVFQKACPLFVPLVEEGLLYDSVTIEVADRYLHDLLSYGIDTLVLGCTHYPLIRRTIQKVAGEGVSLVSPAYETAKELEKIISDKDLSSSLETTTHEFYVSDSADRFKKLASSILPCDIDEVGYVNIEQYG
ncbi:MAG: glutamate racemase [Lachnospiraceae bacterium]|nr:glutamate racemase [Lachnospiraceae bacterium]